MCVYVYIYIYIHVYTYIYIYIYIYRERGNSAACALRSPAAGRPAAPPGAHGLVVMIVIIYFLFPFSFLF